jgi:hypothetical protein
VTRQQRFERMVARYWSLKQSEASGNAIDDAACVIANYVSQNAHLVTIQSGNGVQEAMRSGARR